MNTIVTPRTQQCVAALNRLADEDGNIFAKSAATIITTQVLNHFGRGPLTDDEQDELLLTLADALDATIGAIADALESE